MFLVFSWKEHYLRQSKFKLTRQRQAFRYTRVSKSSDLLPTELNAAWTILEKTMVVASHTAVEHRLGAR
jgi:hypothetical protein